MPTAAFVSDHATVAFRESVCHPTPQHELASAVPLPRSAPALQKRSMLEKGIDVLSSFSGDDVLSLTQIAHRTGLPVPTAHRLVAELLANGLLERVGRDLRLGRRLGALGACVPHQRRLRETALPHLQRLHQATGDVAALTVRYSDEVDKALELSRIGTGVDPVAVTAAAQKALRATHHRDAIMLHHPEGEMEHGAVAKAVVVGGKPIAMLLMMGSMASRRPGQIVPLICAAASSIAQTFGVGEEI